MNIIKEFLKTILPDKGEWKSQLFVKTKTCPFGILLDGKAVKEKLKYEMEKALQKQKKDILRGIKKMRMTERIGDGKDGASWNKRAFYYNQACSDIKAFIKKQ